MKAGIGTFKVPWYSGAIWRRRWDSNSRTACTAWRISSPLPWTAWVRRQNTKKPLSHIRQWHSIRKTGVNLRALNAFRPIWVHGKGLRWWAEWSWLNWLKSSHEHFAPLSLDWVYYTIGCRWSQMPMIGSPSLYSSLLETKSGWITFSVNQPDSSLCCILEKVRRHFFKAVPNTLPAVQAECWAHP